MVRIGVLGLQGAIREHIQALEATGAEGIIIKQKEQLDEIDGLILPGGESTTISRLIDKYNFFGKLTEFGKLGKPIFGTCAGLILLAKEIVGQEHVHLGLMDMTVERNAFGRQCESFEAKLAVKGIAEDVEAVFIRAPYITKIGPQVEVLANYQDNIVAARQGHYLCCSFHPELTDDHHLTEYFVKMVETSYNKVS